MNEIACSDIWTDGCFDQISGMGAWAVLIVNQEGKNHFSGFKLRAGDSSGMEVLAVTRALRAAPKDRPVRLFIDSNEVIMRGQGYSVRTNKKIAPYLPDFYAAIALHANIAWVKIKGHSGIPENEFVDRLARTALIKGMITLGRPLNYKYQGRPLPT